MVKLCALLWLMLLPEIDIAFLLVLMAASGTLLLSSLHYHPQEDLAVS